MKSSRTSSLLYLVCHGEPEATRYDQPSDLNPPLSPRGYRQAQSLAVFGRTRNVSAIYCGPQLAAVSTAKPMLRYTTARLYLRPALRGAAVGMWTERQSFDTIRDEAWRFTKQILGENPDGRVVFMTSGLVIQAILSKVLKLPFDRLREVEQDYAGVSLVRCLFGKLTSHYVNRTLPLLEERVAV